MTRGYPAANACRRQHTEKGWHMDETIARLNIESLRSLLETEQHEMLLKVLRRFLEEEEQKLQQIKFIPDHNRDN